MERLHAAGSCGTACAACSSSRMLDARFRSSIGKSHAVDFDWSHEDLDGDELMHKVMDGLKVLDDKISHVIGRQHQQIRAQYVGGAAGAAAEMEAAAIALTSASSSSSSTSGVQI